MPPLKSKEPLTDDEKFKAQMQVENELGRLQRQYTILERDRHQFACGLKLAKQNRVLSIFKKEHHNILTDLQVAGAPANKKQDARISEDLTALLECYDIYSFQVKTERQYIKEIESQIKMVEKDVVELRSQQTTDRQHEERTWAAIKTVEALENKMEVQIKKFCTICATNRDMRQEIDHLLWERDAFMKIWDKMINKLVIGKRFMLDLIEQATLAYDQREEWCSKLQALRFKAHFDLVHHSEEMREMKRRVDHSKKLEAFLNIKGQKRVMRDLELKEKERRIANNAKLKDQEQQYKAYMDEILEFTNEPHVGAIVRCFNQREAQNFMLFKYINDLIEEMEGVNDKLGYLYLDIEEQRFLASSRLESQRQKLADLEHELEKLENEVEDSDAELQAVETNLSKMLTGIETLFKICRCDRDPILQLLGDNTTVKDYNALFYLEILEKKVHDTLLQVALRDKTMFERKKISAAQKVLAQDKIRLPLYPLDRIVESNPCPLCVEYEMVSAVIDTLQCVMSRSKAKKKLENRRNLPDAALRIHNVSDCYLPKSRAIIQKRYQ